MQQTEDIVEPLLLLPVEVLRARMQSQDHAGVTRERQDGEGLA
jgi:hypothetical protein